MAEELGLHFLVAADRAVLGVAPVEQAGLVEPSQRVELPAQQPVALAAGGTRIVLTRVARPLARGDRVPLTLVLRYADGTTQDVEVDAEVRRRSPSEDHGHGGHRH